MTTKRARQQCLIGLSSSDDLRIALHYKDAFDILYKSEGYQDHIVMPSLFMVRQFLELGLKYNIRKLSQISKKKDYLQKLSSLHDLEKLYKQAFLIHYREAKKILTISIRDQQMLNDLELIIKIISSLDYDSQGFRYSKDKDGNKIIEINEQFDLVKVKELLESVENFLCNIQEVIK